MLRGIRKTGCGLERPWVDSQWEEVAEEDGDASDTWDVDDVKAAGLFRIVQ